MSGYLYYKHVGDYPNDMETGWTEELQGVTHDKDHWFITQKSKIWKLPVCFDLNQRISGIDPASEVLTAEIPSDLRKKGYDHFGDLDYFEEFLYIPLEGKRYIWPLPPIPLLPCKILLFNPTNLRYLCSADLPSKIQDHASWCAVNPLNRLLYSSSGDKLYAYSCEVRQEPRKIKLILEYSHEVKLYKRNGKKLSLNGANGGVFSETGLLFISSYADDTRGILVLDLERGRNILHIPVDSDFDTIGEEIEGITYWNLDFGRAPHIKGQIHLMELDNDVDSDDLKCFKHYRLLTSRFVGNSYTKEVHKSTCNWVVWILDSHKVPYAMLKKALKDGYNGCAHCLKEYHTR